MALERIAMCSSDDEHDEIELQCVPIRFTIEDIYKELGKYKSDISSPHMALFKNKFLIYINEKRELKCFNTEDNQNIPICHNPSLKVMVLAICGDRIVSINREGSSFYLKVFEFSGAITDHPTITINRFLCTKYKSTHFFYPIITAIDNNTVAYCCEQNNKFTVFNIAKNSVERKFSFDNYEFQCLTPIGSDLIACGYKKEASLFGYNQGGIIMFDWEKGNTVYKNEENSITPILRVIAFNNELVLGLCKDSNTHRSHIHKWNIKSKQYVNVFDCPAEVKVLEFIKLNDNHFAIVGIENDQRYIKIHCLSNFTS